MNNLLMRALIYESYAFEKMGGEIRQVKYLLKHIDRTRFETAIVLPFQSSVFDAEASSGTLVSVVEPPLGLRAYNNAILAGSVFALIRSVFDLARYTYRMMRFIRYWPCDVIHCCSVRALLLIGPAARLLGVPIVFVVNGRLNNPLLDTVAYVLASRIVFQCKSNMEDRYSILRKVFRRKLAIIEEGIDLDAINHRQRSAAAPAALGVDRGKVNVMVLGFLNPAKGVQYLIDAVAHIRTSLSNVQLWVVGDQVSDGVGDYRATLERQVVKLGLQGVVRFTGWRADALELLAAMDVLVHPSLSEGMPHAVLEAMALGKAVVATRVGCTRETIRNGENGFLVDPKNSEQLAEALTQVIQDSSLRAAVGVAASNTIVDKHSIIANTRALENIYAALARSAASSSASGTRRSSG